MRQTGKKSEHALPSVFCATVWCGVRCGGLWCGVGGDSKGVVVWGSR